MKKKNIFKTVIVSSVFFLGLGMNSCIEQTFPESSTATADQVANSPAGMQAMQSSDISTRIIPMVKVITSTSAIVRSA